MIGYSKTLNEVIQELKNPNKEAVVNYVDSPQTKRNQEHVLSDIRVEKERQNQLIKNTFGLDEAEYLKITKKISTDRTVEILKIKYAA